MVQRQGGGGGGQAASGPAPSASSQILEGTVQNLAENFIEKAIPPAKFAIVFGKLANAFGEGVGAGIARARAELQSRYARNRPATPSHVGWTEADTAELQDRRRYQAHAVAQLGSVLKEGLINTVKKAVEIVAEEVVGLAVEGPMTKIGDAIGDFAGDVITGDYVSIIDFVSQATEDKVQETTAKITVEVGKAFAQSVAEYATQAGMTELETRALLEEHGLPVEAGQQAAAGMAIEGIGPDVQQKINVARGRMRGRVDPGWEREYHRFQTSYSEILMLNQQLQEMGLLREIFTGQDEALEEKMRKLALEAHGALFNLGNLYFPQDQSGVSFQVDIDALGAFRSGLRD
jgi:hypothetical protein